MSADTDEVGEASAVICRLEEVPQSRSAVFQTVIHKGAVTESLLQEVSI